MAGRCDAGSCEVEAGTGGEAEARACRCGNAGCQGTDPLECAAGMWSGAFCQAMKEVQVELLKSKIQKAWGAKMEKAADAVLEAMGVEWQSMLAQAKAKADFRERLRGLWQ